MAFYRVSNGGTVELQWIDKNGSFTLSGSSGNYQGTITIDLSDYTFEKVVGIFAYLTRNGISGTNTQGVLLKADGTYNYVVYFNSNFYVRIYAVSLNNTTNTLTLNLVDSAGAGSGLYNMQLMLA